MPAVGEKPPVGVDDGWASYRPALSAAFGISNSVASKTTVRTYTTTSPARGNSLPSGYVALKGEELTCHACGVLHGTLNQDLPEDLGPRNYKMLDNMRWTSCCSDPHRAYKLDPAQVDFLWHIKGRGWV